MGGASLLFRKKEQEESDIGEEYLRVHLGRIPPEFYLGLDPAVTAMRQATHAALTKQVSNQGRKDKKHKKGGKHRHRLSRDNLNDTKIEISNLASGNSNQKNDEVNEKNM